MRSLFFSDASAPPVSLLQALHAGLMLVRTYLPPRHPGTMRSTVTVLSSSSSPQR
jgi:hypothetical protein